MKIVSLLLLTLFLAKGCANQNKIDMSTASIEYNTVTRGSNKTILVENQTVAVSSKRDEKSLPTPISDADWKLLVAEFQKLNLEGIPNLKAPTEKRFYDGAAIANLKIKYQGKTYETKGFDHGFPPQEIEKIVTQIVSFTQK